MPNKRSKRKQTQRFFCPNCNQRLWRLGGSKFSAGDKGYNNKDWSEELAWTEEFVCENHGRMRMLVTQNTNGTLAAVPAKRDRHRTLPRSLSV